MSVTEERHWAPLWHFGVVLAPFASVQTYSDRFGDVSQNSLIFLIYNLYF